VCDIKWNPALWGREPADIPSPWRKITLCATACADMRTTRMKSLRHRSHRIGRNALHRFDQGRNLCARAAIGRTEGRCSCPSEAPPRATTWIGQFPGVSWQAKQETPRGADLCGAKNVAEVTGALSWIDPADCCRQAPHGIRRLQKRTGETRQLKLWRVLSSKGSRNWTFPPA
jgi:hypothetical protein